MTEIDNYFLNTYFLLSFNSLFENKVFDMFLKLLNSLIYSNDIREDLRSYNNFLMVLKKERVEDFSIHLEKLIYHVVKNLENTTELQKELNILSNLTAINYAKIKNYLIEKYKNEKLFENLPVFHNSIKNFKLEDFKTKTFIDLNNLYQENRVFIFDDSFELKPIQVREELSFKNLKGYEIQKKTIYNNTKALLEGVKVNNILLYGDAGCGKSSTIRALLGEFEEIKIVQIFKKNLINLDKLYSILENVPYKFIIFADDISFDELDENFSTMKAVLEGSFIQCPKNATIYATSNRRHIVKEGFKSRIGDEIHLKDTINELTSLSERFGITLLFSKPTNEEFKKIVLELAKDKHIKMDEEILLAKAQRSALIKGSNSPRVASQFIDNLFANIEI